MKTVMDWFGVRKEYETKGDIGIEVEVEGRRLPDAPKHWRREHDGSLRGPETAEYVFEKPLTRRSAKIALRFLKMTYKHNKSEVFDSVRAGIHVHVNVQKLSIIELFNYVTLYLILEPLLIKYCGEGREGNLFCLRATDARYQLYCIQKALQNRRFRHLVHDDLRYGAMNVKALGTYGSLEFRAMRSTDDVDKIYNWASMLLDIRERAVQYRLPTDVIHAYSEGDADGFLIDALGKKNAEMLMALAPDYADLLKQGMRCAQDIAFAANWERFNEEDLVEIGGLKFPKHVWFDEPIGDF